MKIMLNGATGGTNFGDYLFAEIFQNEVASLVGEENVYWYQSRYSMSDFYCRHLHYDRRRCRLSEIDALVSISGGYFCGADHGFRDYLIRYLRYFRLSLQCIRRKIPIAILGVETYASIAWVIASIPVCAVSFFGIVSASSGSTIAISGVML